MNSLSILVLFGMMFFFVSSYRSDGKTNDFDDPDRMLIVLSAAQRYDSSYKEDFDAILDFDISFAKEIMDRDNVVVISDYFSMSTLRKELPDDILLLATVDDIWMRDFGTVIPEKMVQFNYDRPETPSIEKTFDNLISRLKLDVKKVNDISIDGGNVVENGYDKIVMTEKVFERNPSLSESQLINELKSILDISEIAIIEMDEEELGHSDGMVSFVEKDILIVNNYSSDPNFAKSIITSLTDDLSNVTFKFIDGEGYGETTGKFASACGIYVNSVVTYKYIYMPVFKNEPERDIKAKRVFETSGTNKTVIPIDSSGVCKLGGNTRCLSWQMTGENAKKVIKQARKFDILFYLYHTLFLSLIVVCVLVVSFCLCSCSICVVGSSGFCLESIMMRGKGDRRNCCELVVGFFFIFLATFVFPVGLVELCPMLCCVMLVVWIIVFPSMLCCC